MRTGADRTMQWNRMSNLLLIAAIALANAGQAAAAEDPYLQGLRQEASTLERLGQAKKEFEQLEKQQGGRQAAPAGQKEAARQDRKKAAPSAAPISSAEIAAFENGLKQYPAGYGLYKQLDAKGQQDVLGEYAQTTGHPGTRYLAAIKRIIFLSTGTR